MTPIRQVSHIANLLHAAIGQAYIGVANLADDDQAAREVGRLHLREAAKVMRECADRLEKLSRSETK